MCIYIGGFIVRDLLGGEDAGFVVHNLIGAAEQSSIGINIFFVPGGYDVQEDIIRGIVRHSRAACHKTRCWKILSSNSVG